MSDGLGSEEDRASLKSVAEDVAERRVRRGSDLGGIKASLVRIETMLEQGDALGVIINLAVYLATSGRKLTLEYRQDGVSPLESGPAYVGKIDPPIGSKNGYRAKTLTSLLRSVVEDAS